MCVANVTIQINGPPKNATPIRNRNAVLLNLQFNAIAAAIPRLDARTAATGIPRLLSLPRIAGAYPPRDSENNIRAVKYKLQSALDSAADSTTKFMM